MVDLELVKQSLSVFGNHHDDLISHYIEAAKGFVEKHIDREVLSEAPDEELREDQVVIDATIKQAIMQLTGFFYLNRENQEFGGYGPSAVSVVDRLLIGYKRF